MKHLFYCLLAMTSFASCSKDDIDTPEEPEEIFLLKELETQETIMKLEYNDRNQLKGGENYVKSINGSVPFNSFFKLIYENNKPVKMQYRKDSEPAFADASEFFYDEKGNMSKIYFTGFPDTTYRFKYNSEGKMIYFSMKTYAGLSETDFGYDAKGNLKQDNKAITTQWTGNGGVNTDSAYYTYNFTYDDKKNPFSYNNIGQFMAAMGMVSEETMELVLSQNNPLGYTKHRLNKPQNYTPATERSSNTIVNYVNTFDSNGWLTSCYKQTRVEQFTGTELSFVYESNSPVMKFKIEKR